MTTPHQELPKILSSQKVFDGRVFNVTVDTISEGELTYQREVVHHSGSAVIIPVFDDGDCRARQTVSSSRRSLSS